jgi:hypothetical protein
MAQPRAAAARRGVAPQYRRLEESTELGARHLEG